LRLIHHPYFSYQASCEYRCEKKKKKRRKDHKSKIKKRQKDKLPRSSIRPAITVVYTSRDTTAPQISLRSVDGPIRRSFLRSGHVLPRRPGNRTRDLCSKAGRGQAGCVTQLGHQLRSLNTRAINWTYNPLNGCRVSCCESSGRAGGSGQPRSHQGGTPVQQPRSQRTAQFHEGITSRLHPVVASWP
jgi:hypothetical protein